jgi:hypothetical protein
MPARLRAFGAPRAPDHDKTAREQPTPKFKTRDDKESQVTSIFDGTITETGAIVIYAGDDDDPTETHRCTTCRRLFGTEFSDQRTCDLPPCASARQAPDMGVAAQGPEMTVRR